MTTRICLSGLPTDLNPHFHPRDSLSYCVTPSLITIIRWYRNINLLSITYAFRPRLRVRLTLSGLSLLKETLDLRRTCFSQIFSLLIPA